MDEMNKGLTPEDIKARELVEGAKRLNLAETALPQPLLDAIVEERMLRENKANVRRVPEEIFVRDILPAISGELGEISMRWWVDQFGSATSGFIVAAANQAGVMVDLFEHPPMAPAAGTANQATARPVGDMMANFRNRQRISPEQSSVELKSQLRSSLTPDEGVIEWIYNISQVERICRRYGKSIIDKSKPEFQKAIEDGVAGLDEALGTLGVYGKSAPLAIGVAKKESNDAYDDDEAPAGTASFD